MAHLAVGFFLNLAAFAGLGFGPCLWCIRGKRRLSMALALAPACGFGLVSVAGTILTVSNWPVFRWCIPLLVVGMFASLLLATRVLMTDGSVASEFRGRAPAWPLAVALVTAILLIAPPVLGGLQYSILRGDGADSFNYLATAGYLDHEPFSWMSEVDVQTLVDRHPSYLRAKGLLSTRWTTMMLLAFESRVAGSEPYQFEFMFSLLCALLTFGPAYLWMRRWMDLPRSASLMAAMIICCGFWAQFVVDERADSHQNAIPVAMSLACLVLHLDERDDDARWAEHGLLGLMASALLFIYPEMIAMVALGTVLFLAVRLSAVRDKSHWAVGWVFSASVAALAALPLRQLLIGFIQLQFQRASSGVSPWEHAYFQWLYVSPLTGFWGFGPLVAQGAFASRWLHLVLTPLGAFLTFVLVVSMLRIPLRSTRSGLALAGTLAVAALLQAGYLYFRGQLWPAGKGLSFGAPFLILAVVGHGFAHDGNGRSRLRQRWRQSVTVAIALFFASQIFLALYRPWLASNSQEYRGYIEHHGEYRRHDWNLETITDVLRAKRGSTVWTYLRNITMADYVGLAIGWDVHLVHVGAARDVEELGAPRQRLDDHPDFLLVDRDGLDASSLENVNIVAAANRELVLLRMGNAPILAAVENPNGVEGDTSAHVLWLGGAHTLFNIVAPTAGCAQLAARMIPGPSRPDDLVRHLRVTPPADAETRLVVNGGGPQTVDFRTRPGLNVLGVEVEEPPTVKLPTDPRPLLLRVDQVQVRATRCGPA